MPASTTRPVSPPVRSRWPSKRLSNESENVSVTMPVKITSSERLTAIQLRAPPMIAAPMPARAMLNSIGMPTRSLRIADV